MTQSNRNRRAILLEIAVALAVLGWVAQLVVGWFVPPLLVAAAIVITIIGAIYEHRGHRTDGTRKQ